METSYNQPLCPTLRCRIIFSGFLILASCFIAFMLVRILTSHNHDDSLFQVYAQPLICAYPVVWIWILTICCITINRFPYGGRFEIYAAGLGAVSYTAVSVAIPIFVAHHNQLFEITDVFMIVLFFQLSIVSWKRVFYLRRRLKESKI